MTDRECVEFLQWALPRMRLRWPGFRKVRGQVCKRISRRIAALGLPDAPRYQTYLDANPTEWTSLAELCRVTISRFHRDAGVFGHIGAVVLPRLDARGGSDASCWSAGCASGEEAYTMQILWKARVGPTCHDKSLRVLGTDADAHLLERARAAVYPGSALRDLPTDLAKRAFDAAGGRFRLKETFKENVRFEEQDIRTSMPGGPIDVILCRNLVFTYFDESLQLDILDKLVARLAVGGVLVTGLHESLPSPAFPLAAEAPAIYERLPDTP